MTDLNVMGQKAEAAKYELQLLGSEEKNKGLETCAKGLLDHADDIIAENKKDLDRGEQNGMHSGMLDRLRLTKDRIQAMAEGLLEIAKLEDPIGQLMEEFERPNSMLIRKVRVPIGVIGIIYESRPNVTADAFGLCFKAGNAVILKGGSDAISSNIAIENVLREGLRASGITEDAIQLIADTDRAVTKEFMGLNEYVDLLIPRGGAGLIRAVVENSTIPVIETGTGNCHIFVDESADLQMALDIIYNAKTQRIGVCNACESLVVHEKIAEKLLPLLQQRLSDPQVEIRGDERTAAILPNCTPAASTDYGMEYLDYILSCKIVNNVQEAIIHINKYSTKHSEAIITANNENAEAFLNGVDAACVYVNASTRFTDGFVFGFGAEIGISTQKIHARGPMGLKELTSYKYTITGTGQIRE